MTILLAIYFLTVIFAASLLSIYSSRFTAEEIALTPKDLTMMIFCIICPFVNITLMAVIIRDLEWIPKIRQWWDKPL